jgi:hypothetical protein
MELLNIKAVDMLQEPPKVGDVIMCGGCGYPNEVCLTGTRLLLKKDFKELKVEEKLDLDFAARAITPKGKNE